MRKTRMTFLAIIAAMFALATSAMAETRIVSCPGNPGLRCRVNITPIPIAPVRGRVLVAPPVRTQVGVNIIPTRPVTTYIPDQPHKVGRCEYPNEVYVEEFHNCFEKVRDQAVVDQVVPDAHIDNDDRCIDKPSGYEFKTPFKGPHGREGYVLRRCR